MKPLADRTLVGWARWASGILFMFGLVAIFRGQFDDFTGAEVSVLGFFGSPLTNLIHLLVAIAMIAALGSLAATRTAALVVGIGFTVFGLLEFVLGDGSADIFGRNTRMEILDLVIGITGLAVWAWSTRARPPRVEHVDGASPVSPG